MATVIAHYLERIQPHVPAIGRAFMRGAGCVSHADGAGGRELFQNHLCSAREFSFGAIISRMKGMSA